MRKNFDQHGKGALNSTKSEPLGFSNSNKIFGHNEKSKLGF